MKRIVNIILLVIILGGGTVLLVNHFTKDDLEARYKADPMAFVEENRAKYLSSFNDTVDALLDSVNVYMQLCMDEYINETPPEVISAMYKKKMAKFYVDLRLVSEQFGEGYKEAGVPMEDMMAIVNKISEGMGKHEDDYQALKEYGFDLRGSDNPE
jgi:hypothetical protein